MKFLPIAITLTLLPIPVMAQGVVLPEQVYVNKVNEIAAKVHPTSPYINKTNREKIADGNIACLWVKNYPAKDYLKSKIYDAFNRFPDDNQQDDFLYLIDYHQAVLASAVYVLCPQHLKEYAAVNDRISQEGLEWIIQP